MKKMCLLFCTVAGLLFILYSPRSSDLVVHFHIISSPCELLNEVWICHSVRVRACVCVCVCVCIWLLMLLCMCQNQHVYL